MSVRQGLCRLSLVATAVFGSACGQQSGVTPTVPDAGDKFARTQYTVIWTDPAGVDLMSPEGTYIRASVESLDVSATNGNADAAAPGFWDTLSGNATKEAGDFFAMGPAQPEYGIKRYEILDKVDSANSTTVTVCSYNQQVGHHKDAEEYEFGGTGPFGLVLTIEKVGDKPPPARQSGPETFMMTKVFGSWRTTSWQVGYFSGGDPCAGRPLPGVAPESWPRTRGGGPYTATEVPTAPSHPGWPGPGGL